MKLRVVHSFPCTPENFWKMYWDPEFDELVRRESKVERQILHESTEGDVMTRRVRMIPDRELPTPVAKLIGSTKLVYDQESRFDRKRGHVTWKVLPSVLPGKLDASGTFLVRATEDGCEQVVDGEIKVNVMLVGGTIERAVVDEVERSYARHAEACRKWLREKGLEIG